MIDKLQEGIRRVNQAFVEHPEFDRSDYTEMVVRYLISVLLMELGQSGEFGLYEYPDSVGFVGWVGWGDCTLFFAPTKSVILCGDERSRMENTNDLSA